MMHRNWLGRWALGGALLCGLVTSAGADAPLVDQTRILDKFTITDVKDFSKKSMPVKSKAFKSQAGAGPVWVLYYYVAALPDPSSSGETLFDVGVTDVKMNPADTVMLFASDQMASIDRSKPMKEPGETGYVTPVAALALKQRLPESDYAAYMKALRSDKAVRHLVASKSYDVPVGTETQVLVSTLRTTNMRPMSLEVVVGQGPMPRELQAFSKKTNGSWFVRHLNAMAALGALLLAGLYMLYRLRR